ncbi:M23 family metallopeptidase [uncultured Desulfuromusa sp.]|uniref:M23 family metallopeptidase n=1 Tax=uncultured Desulfuromusa sp. TaxID=219183 RepID=UPI002AA64C6E|nr:M23 family metallopeptidase [uncultured Desulfuromusa sp.]
MKSIKKLFVLLVVIGLVAAGIFYFRDTKPPLLSLTPGNGPVSKNTKILLSLNDEGMGIKSVEVVVIQGSNQLPLLKRAFSPQTAVADLDLDLSALKLQEGELRIDVTSTDQSIYHFGKGNTINQQFTLTYDSRAPIISLLSKAHNFTKGGSGLATFSLNEKVVSAGVQFADYFFPAYQQESGNYACLFAYPYNVKESDFVPRIVARDLAGNERQLGMYYRANNKKFRQRKINISDKFLSQKAPEFETLAPDIENPLDVFLYINRQVRQQNREKIAELSTQTSPTPLWNGAFMRQPQAASLAQFADHRTYYYNGKEIDKQVHHGQDLASIAQTEIVAENAGEVLWADYMGIYGLCVLIDHGLGLQSLYAHMSQLNVTPGDILTRGQVIGRSGTTGMAGGDHLHLGVFVAGVPVQPIEWWDASWLRNNIDSKL